MACEEIWIYWTPEWYKKHHVAYNGVGYSRVQCNQMYTAQAVSFRDDHLQL